MHLIITDPRFRRSLSLDLNGWRLAAVALVSALVLLVTSLGLYHWVFLEGARQGWPIVGPVVRVLLKDELATKDAFMRENLDAMARRVGQMQARLVQLESLGERVAGLAGVNPTELRPRPGSGGVLLAERSLTADELRAAIERLDATSSGQIDWLTLAESRLFEQKMRKNLMPTEHPVTGVALGSAFGWRIDPITGQSALHSGLDFPADVGAPIVAAAGGVVVVAEFHPAYGQMLEVDHGNDLVTRYAHASRVLVQKGDVVRRGQKIAEVGTTGRSTGPHLHFEVLVSGVPQDPMKFLSVGTQVAETPPRSVVRR